MTKQNMTATNMDEMIALFGGVLGFMRACQLARNTAYRWRNNGDIPVDRRERVLGFAEKKGIVLPKTFLKHGFGG